MTPPDAPSPPPSPEPAQPEPSELRVLTRYPARLRWQMEAAVLTTRGEGGPSSVNTFSVQAAEHYLAVLSARHHGGEPFDVELGRRSVGQRKGRG